MNGGHLILWEFIVKAGREAEFERHYAGGGSWAALFSRARGYGGTELLRDRADPHRYLTVDRWADETAFREFKQRFAAEYEALDRECEGLTARETPLGEYGRPDLR